MRGSKASLLPGGRVIAALGNQYVTGYGPFGLAISLSGRTVATSNGGPDRNSLTILARDRSAHWDVRQIAAGEPDAPGESESGWRSVFMGLAFMGERSLFAAEGNSGRISLFDLSGERRRTIDLNQKGYLDSYTGDLAFDSEREILYAIDQANFRVAVVDARTRQLIASVRVGRLPFALALSPDRRELFVTNLGMFEYQSIPGADPAQARATGLGFPAFGFPSAEATAGVERQTERGRVRVPGLGDPNVPQSNSLCVLDVADPGAPKVEVFIRTGLPFGGQTHGGSSPSGVVAGGGRVFVANANDDSISIIDPAANRVEAEVPVRIPGLASFRGVLPVGMAYYEPTGWLLVAEAGINAVGVIDWRARRVLGHLPVGWFPTRVAIDGDTVFVANARGQGAGPNSVGAGLRQHWRQGSLSVFPMPRADELPSMTALVMEANGFQARPGAARSVPVGIQHVVLIVKENRTYDEVFGDLIDAANGPAMGVAELARFGSRGYINGRRSRLSIKDVDVTPNHHSIARQWAFSDNFYADSDVSVDGHHWLVGSYPNAWTESSMMSAYSAGKDFRLNAAPGRRIFAESNSSLHPEEQLEGGAIWHHLERHAVSFRNFGEGFELAGNQEGRGLEPTGARLLTNVPMPDPLYRNTSRQYPGFNMNVPDQYRAAQFIREIDEQYVVPGAMLPQFIYVHLPNDHMAEARPDDGYPYRESFVADNDLALGRILQYLSGTKWWPDMAVFITEDDAQGGVDHIDAHRTLLIAAGPWIKRGYVSHVNTSFPGLLKTIFRLLRLPPLNLFDATASDLGDCFAAQSSGEVYHIRDVDKRLFDPATARESRQTGQSPQMDDPRLVRRLQQP